MRDLQVCVVGLGYVGLPLAVEFAKNGVSVIGFDINQRRITQLAEGLDASGEMKRHDLEAVKIHYSTKAEDIEKANFVIAAIPTPVDKTNRPDLSLVESASRLIGQNLQKGAVVVFESTVYPGITEEICLPIIEQESRLKCGIDWKVGYSPERINPGDKEHTIDKIIKVVSAMDAESLEKIAEVYSIPCKAGVFRAASIKVAEAAKVIENTQRDINIALINELSLIFHRLGINTRDVLEAAGTKWNFLNFTPGLVGGHCIGVDPYYLVQKAVEVGYHPEVITAGRRVNDYMATFVAEETIRGLIITKKSVYGARILVMGLTFKENVRDLRNSKIAETIKILDDYGAKVVGFDPYLNKEEISSEFGISSISHLCGHFDAVIVATPHREFIGLEHKLLSIFAGRPVVVDVKGIYRSFENTKGVVYKSL